MEIKVLGTGCCSMRTPALVVDEKVLSVGKVLTVEEISSILKSL